MAGFEPATFRLTAERSTDWATRAYIYLKSIILLKGGRPIIEDLTRQKGRRVEEKGVE